MKLLRHLIPGRPVAPVLPTGPQGPLGPLSPVAPSVLLKPLSPVWLLAGSTETVAYYTLVEVFKTVPKLVHISKESS